MFVLILFYVMKGQFHTEVNSLVVDGFRTVELCEAGRVSVVETLKKSTPDAVNINYSCVRVERQELSG